jgi:hypothetical protein
VYVNRLGPVAREEEEPVRAFPQDRGAHGNILADSRRFRGARHRGVSAVSPDFEDLRRFKENREADTATLPGSPASASGSGNVTGARAQCPPMIMIRLTCPNEPRRASVSFGGVMRSRRIPIATRAGFECGVRKTDHADDDRPSVAPLTKQE